MSRQGRMIVFSIILLFCFSSLLNCLSILTSDVSFNPRTSLFENSPSSITVARATLFSSRTILVIAGATFTFIIVYGLASELFSPNSPTVVYGEACKLVKNSEAVSDGADKWAYIPYLGLFISSFSPRLRLCSSFPFTGRFTSPTTLSIPHFHLINFFNSITRYHQSTL